MAYRSVHMQWNIFLAWCKKSQQAVFSTAKYVAVTLDSTYFL
jgi:hypothetical protein